MCFNIGKSIFDSNFDTFFKIIKKLWCSSSNVCVIDGICVAMLNYIRFLILNTYIMNRRVQYVMLEAIVAKVAVFELP